MRVTVGSANKTKVDAVRAAMKEYEQFADAEVVALPVQIDEFGHPKNLEDVVAGAMDRAKQAFQECQYSVGIEGGLMTVPQTKTGFMEVAVCAIYDGAQYYLGLSPACEWPKAALHGILHKGLDGSQALRDAGFTDHPKLGTDNGLIAMLTNGRMDRTAYNKIAVQMALIQLLHPDYYA